MERKIKMYCVDVDNDGSEFEVRFEINGEILERETVYSFDDVLIVSYEFFKKNCEKYNFDSRRDILEVCLSYTY